MPILSKIAMKHVASMFRKSVPVSLSWESWQAHGLPYLVNHGNTANRYQWNAQQCCLSHRLFCIDAKKTTEIAQWQCNPCKEEAETHVISKPWIFVNWKYDLNSLHENSFYNNISLLQVFEIIDLFLSYSHLIIDTPWMVVYTKYGFSRSKFGRRKSNETRIF